MIENKQLPQFLDLLFRPDDIIEIRPIETWTDTDGKKQSRIISKFRQWVYRKDFNDSTIEALAECNKNHNGNIFFGVNPRLTTASGGKSDISCVTCLWTDIDDCTFDQFKTKIKELKIVKPSIVVNSGNGIHAYWLLNERIWLDDTMTVHHIENTVGRLLDAIGGKRMKGTQDISRILRLPHPQFMNVKNARNGQQPKPVSIVHFDATLKYTIDDIIKCLPTDAICAKLAELGISKDDQAEPTKSEPKPKTDIDIIIEELDKKVSDRSKRDYAICAKLAELGVTKDDAWQLVCKHSKFAGRDYKYFNATWDRASSVAKTAAPKIVQHPFVKPTHDDDAPCSPIPLDHLPSPMKEMVAESIKSYGGNGAATLTWALATLSASTGNLCQVHHVGQHWSVKHLPTSLYFAIIGESGSQKSVSNKEFLRPFADAQVAHSIEFGKRQADAKSKLSSLTAQIAGKRNAIAKATEKGDDIESLNAAAVFAGND